MLAFNFVGDGLRDAADPYARKVDDRGLEFPVLEVTIVDRTRHDGVRADPEDVIFTSARQVLALVGESGSGKSVTAQALLSSSAAPVGRQRRDPVPARTRLRPDIAGGPGRREIQALRGGPSA